MDHALVEQITRLVMEQLEKPSDTRPLTNEEIWHWQEIAPAAANGKVGKQTQFRTEMQDTRPLSEQEIRDWNNISVSFSNGRNHNRQQHKEQVRFSHF
ncbi:hypothetical protein [Bacillus piscicola]|uniref:hypothetical protein n=1 Tax=Bacillus piscicola TaxID=1632684 RepID=UPI001F09AD0B|nr:hypothetical protein [Bacillus piscicola]